MKENEEDITLFKVTERNLEDEYPELADIKEFKDLKARELKVVWYYANPTSPIAHYSDKSRMENALKLSYGRFANRKDLDDLRKGKFSLEFQAALDRMKGFNISIRIQAKLLNEHIFHNLITITSVENSQLKAMELDDQKKYAELSLKVAKEMPELVQKIESAYGVKQTKNNNKKANVKVSVGNLGL